MNLNFADGSEFLFTFFVSFKQFSFSTVISTVAFCSDILFDMRNLLFCNGFGSDSCLDADSKELCWDLLFKFGADIFTEIVGFFGMD